MIKGILVFVYYLFSIMGTYYIGKGIFISNDKSIIPFLIIMIVLLIVYIIFAIIYAKDNYDAHFLYYFRLLTYISFILTYGMLWIISLIYTDQGFREVVLFRYEESIFVSIFALITLSGICSLVPIIISTIIFLFLSKRYRNIEYKKEMEYEYKERIEKEQIEKANNEIEYYTKLKELNELLDSGTIDQNKYNSLKSTLKEQYNISE